MTEANMETLSAAMDGELSKEELRFLLRRLDHDASLLQVWSRYHVAGDGLRRQLPAVAGSHFATRVMQLIEDDPSASQTNPKHRDWLRLSVGGAIAASVAVAALMISQPTADSRRPAPLTASVASHSDPGSPPRRLLPRHAPAPCCSAAALVKCVLGLRAESARFRNAGVIPPIIRCSSAIRTATLFHQWL